MSYMNPSMPYMVNNGGDIVFISARLKANSQKPTAKSQQPTAKIFP